MGFPRFLAFSVGRALQGIRRNALMSLAAIATMALMLLLLAGFWLLQAGLACCRTMHGPVRCAAWTASSNAASVRS